MCQETKKTDLYRAAKKSLLYNQNYRIVIWLILYAYPRAATALQLVRRSKRCLLFVEHRQATVLRLLFILESTNF